MNKQDIVVLCACEESQIVTQAFRDLGITAFSNDIIETSGLHPEWHLQMDCFDAIEKIKPTLLIGHPPCTFLTVSGNRAMKEDKLLLFPIREKQRSDAIEFFKKLYNANVKYIALENPVGVISTLFRKPDQYVNPYFFGDAVPKKTGLWLKNLPLLQPTNMVEPKYIIGKRDGKKYSEIHYMTPGMKDRAKLRSKTYAGFAKALANQWSEYILTTA